MALHYCDGSLVHGQRVVNRLWYFYLISNAGIELFFHHPRRLADILYLLELRLGNEMQVTEMLSHISHASLLLLIPEGVECVNVAAKREPSV